MPDHRVVTYSTVVARISSQMHLAEQQNVRCAMENVDDNRGLFRSLGAQASERTHEETWFMCETHDPKRWLSVARLLWSCM